jgi:2-oxoglutarate ferredoxin oxidoreductase subunit gamma
MCRKRENRRNNHIGPRHGSPRKELKNVRVFKVPATKIAEELGRKIVANIAMLGAFVAITGVLDKEAVKESIKVNVPKGTEELNLKAFEKGYEYGKNLLKS